MLDIYQIPALLLTVLLLPAFGYLYLRFRDARTLLWFSGFLFASISMVMFYALRPWNLYLNMHPWLAAGAQITMQISCALILASLSPLRFRVGRFEILYVIPFTIPLVLYSALLYGVFHGITPHGLAFWIFPALGAISLVTGLFWGGARGSMPVSVGLSVIAMLGIPALIITFTRGAVWSLIFVESAIFCMSALLIIFVFRRVSPGVFLSVLGFVAWSLGILRILPEIATNPALDLIVLRVMVMGKVVAAIGMLLLALEDELNLNQIAQERERRAREELGAYASLVLTRRHVQDFDQQGDEICATITAHSCFSQAVLLLQTSGRFSLAGSSGLDEATAKALNELAQRIVPANFLAPGSVPLVVEDSQALQLDLSPWLIPGDDLRRLHFTSVLAVPLRGRTAVDGVLLLAGTRPMCGGPASSALRFEDLLPIEMLAARLQASRSHTMMLEKLVDAEKFAGLGQLAGNVVQQMNNPLTVIMGYASLLEDTQALSATERKGVASILTEARRMKVTLESLTRLSRSRGDQMSAVALDEMLRDLEQLYRSEFLNRSIEFRLNIAPALPLVLCSPHQLRQAVLHCLRFAVEAVDGPASAGSSEPRTIRLEASSENGLVQILVLHSGPGFPDPERAFDPTVPSPAGGEGNGLGLSLCATILRDNNGRAAAMNLEPRGAAILLELRAA